MSDLAEKLAQHRDTGGRARRSHASLLNVRGYRVVTEGPPAVVATRPMDTESRWRHVGSGKWSSPAAEYEKEEA